MVDIQTISIAIASASVVAGVVYYALQISYQETIQPYVGIGAVIMQNVEVTLSRVGVRETFLRGRFWVAVFAQA